MSNICKLLKSLYILVSIFIIAGSLTACIMNRIVLPEFTIGENNYKTGFYSDLWLSDITYTSEFIEGELYEYRYVDNTMFDWVQCYIGSRDTGVLYCNEIQWEEAKEFYSDSNNFVYYCMIGTQSTDRDPLISTLEDIDPTMFDKLMEFAKESEYNPFGSNEDVDTIRRPIPDRDESPKLIFYCESKDGYFNSYKGYKFHNVNGELLLVFYYDYGHGEYENLVAVEVPKELSDYFIEIISEKME